MTIIEKFNSDKEFNIKRPMFTPYDDNLFGKRSQGYFIKETSDEDGEYIRFFFDNGNNYTFEENKNELYECEPIPKIFFLHKYIEKCIYDIIVENSNCKQPNIFCSQCEVMQMDNPILLVRVVLHHNEKKVCVTNIHAVKNHHGFGKQLLNAFFLICKEFNYKLYLTEMVHSFYTRMVNRGATIIEEDNIVEITEETDLTSHYATP